MAIVVETLFRTTLLDGAKAQGLIGRADAKGDLQAVRYGGISVVGTQIGNEWWLVANRDRDDESFGRVGPYTQQTISALINLLPLA